MPSATPKVKIEINDSLIPALRIWIQKFNGSDLARVDDANFNENILIMDAYDVAILIKIASTAESNLMDVHRLKKRAIEALKSALGRARSRLSINRDPRTA